MAAPIQAPISIKLLIHPISQRVVFAEAGKDFVDFLFNIMSLPLATVIRLLSSKQVTAGCIGNIYESIENLGDSSYMLPADKKDMLLKPMVVNYDPNGLLFPILQSSNQTNLYNRCPVYDGNCRKNVINEPNTICPTCRHVINEPNTICPTCRRQTVNFANLTDVPLYSSEGGFVKGAMNFMITDDLIVRPTSTEFIFTLLDKFNIKDFSELQMKAVGVGINEALKLLRELMQSKTALTAVFLGAKKEPSVNS